MAANVFHVFLYTACRNEANDTSLDRYRRGASFSYINLSLIHYGLRAVSNLLNRGTLFFNFFKIFGTVFAPVFKPFVETRRIIYLWIAMENAQPRHVEHFSRFIAV